MADFKMSRAVLVFAVIGFYNVRVIHVAETDIETKVDILEYLLHGVLKNEIADIKDTLRNIQNDKSDHECCKAEKQPGLNQTYGDGIQRLVNEVTAKTKAMITAFSTEKKQMRRQRTYLIEELGVMQVSVDDHENRTRDLVDQMKDNHQVDFEQFMNNTELAMDVIRVSIDDHKNQSFDLVEHLKDKHQIDFEQLIKKIEFVQQQSQQSQQKCDSLQQLIATLSADIDSIKSNNDGKNRKMIPIIESVRCKAGWARQLHSCMLYVNTEYKTWFEAQEYCYEHGGFLVEPYSSAAVTMLMVGAGNWTEDDMRRSLWWIGASDRVQEGVWRWESTGRKIGIVPEWEKDEPNNAGGSEDCALLVYHNYDINDVDCLSRMLFVCEIKL